MTEKIRIALLGDSGAGKTVFCKLLQTGVFSELVCVSLGTELHTYKVNNTEILIYDIPCGVHRIRYQEPYLKRADAVIIFQDATKNIQETDWVGLVKQWNPRAKLFHVRVKVDCRQTVYSSKSRGCISLGDIALSKQPNVEAFFKTFLSKFRSRSWVQSFLTFL